MELTKEQLDLIKGTNQIYTDDGFGSPIDAAIIMRSHIALLLDHITTITTERDEIDGINVRLVARITAIECERDEALARAEKANKKIRKIISLAVRLSGQPLPRDKVMSIIKGDTP